MNALAALDRVQKMHNEALDEILLLKKERIALRTAMEAIRAKRYEDRDSGTFTPETAWPAAQKLNKAICEIFEIAKTALETK